MGGKKKNPIYLFFFLTYFYLYSKYLIYIIIYELFLKFELFQRLLIWKKNILSFLTNATSKAGL